VAHNPRADADPGDGDGVVERPVSPGDAPVAIEARGLAKSFHIPTHRVSRLKERLAHPFARQEYRQLQALRDVSFDVHQGEFFGILGRNGSGKSTLLKILAGIYGADAGSVRMAGRIGPFIELGVGFNMELTARENIVLNGVMMGLTPREARARIDAVLEFSELADFVELKLKNYSSGMLVRLGFSVMIQADTDILLIDEVLAVGDAAFQQKCADVFHRMRDEGRTIVLVTHDTGAVEEFCDRAMLLSDSKIVEIGDPGDVARRYLRVNFEQRFEERRSDEGAGTVSRGVRLLDAWVAGPDGGRITNLEQGSPIRLRAQVETERDLPDPLFGFVIATSQDVNVHEFQTTLSRRGEAQSLLRAGQCITVEANVENQLSPGRYYVHLGVARNENRGDVALYVPHVLSFVVFGDQESAGIVGADHEMWITAGQDGPA
jgi:ABC-type polysaccharide/polyol phosphate transport system ATPase subunit